MTDQRINAYEGLFLFSQAQAGDLQTAAAHIKDILSKVGAEFISLRKWDERRLAYEIKGNKRGVYFLTYFRAPRTAMAELERNCNLSELLLRFMVTRADHLAQEQMEAADGSAELADEIKLRAEQAEPATTAAPDTNRTPENRSEPAEPVTVETEPAKDPAPTPQR